VRAGLDDVLNMFRVWQSDAVLLRCDFSFDRFAACFRARVRDVADKEIKFWSDDTFAELVLRLTPDLLFEYADPRDFPEETVLFSRGVAIVLPAGNSISFLELIESS
jgi:hypothetical protein